jgi:6-phosphogluconolactonase/glucosamine-6-phosphate isomerase/deaminase
MKIILCKDAQHSTRIAHEWLRDAIIEVRAKSVFLPAGNTPISLYAYWERVKPSFLRDLQFVQVDDILCNSHRHFFKNFFMEHLPSYESQFYWVEDGAKVADLAILGLGVNGHVAFHEPHVPPSFTWGCVELDEVTCRNLNVAPGTWGITHGLGNFLLAKKVVILATGRSKASAVAKVLAGDRSTPAGWFFSHPDFSLIADEDAMSLAPKGYPVQRASEHQLF